ncbi:MAG: hypothetical protein PHT30_04450 [Bacilli bacterium]|nr:hypothetical protein [Bacilli bacterium]
MKIYLVETSFGTYEDRYSKIAKAYLSKESAEKWVKEYNDKIVADEAFLEYCAVCKFRQREKKPKGNRPLPGCYEWSESKGYDGYWTCKEWEDRIDAQWDEKHLAKIIEIESED